ncbi:MAG: ATP-binding protein [Alphaproteobacteria bacterium]|nr:ATP-binding protein [Alphaproteobacteria bacterium]
MPDGGEVIISTKAALGGVTIIVADTGAGTAPQALSHLTEPFKRVESNPYRTQTGQGLGFW